MKKLGIISIILGLLLVLFVFAQNEFTFDITDLPENGNPGATASGTFTVTNTLNEDIDDIDITIVEDLEGPTNVGGTTQYLPASSIVISPNNIDLAALETSDDITFTINIPGQQYFGEYTGTINASNGTYSGTIEFEFDVNQVVGINLGSEIGTDNLFFMSGAEDQTISRSFTLINTGNVDITNMQVTITEEVTGSMSDGDKTISFKVNGNTAAFGSAVNVGTIEVGSESITIEATIPNNMDVDTYEGNVTLASTTYPGASASFSLEVRVEPEICEDGRMSNGEPVGNSNTGWVRVNINDPDDGDDFKQGDEIDIDVEVKNEGTQDLDIVVEAILYDLDEDNEITSIKSDSIEIEEEEDFDLTLTVPYDEELDDSNTYFLYVKAYEEDEEDENCNYDAIEMEFKRESHEVIIDGFTINPSVVNPGELVSFIVEAWNVGEKDEDDVYIKLYNAELGLDLETNKFDLEKYDDDDNKETKTISFTVPLDAQAKDYAIEALVYYDDGDESYSTFGTLTVSGEGVTPVVEGEATLSLPQTSISATAGKVFAIPFTVNNNAESSIIYTVEVNAVGAWADSVSETITVEAGSSNTGYAYLTPYSGTSAGTYSATLNLKHDGSILDTKTVTVNVGKVSGITGQVYEPIGTFWDNLTENTWFWIIGNIILVILVIIVLFLIFRKR